MKEYTFTPDIRSPASALKEPNTQDDSASDKIIIKLKFDGVDWYLLGNPRDSQYLHHHPKSPSATCHLDDI